MNQELQRKMFFDMVKIRCFEETVRGLHGEGVVPGAVHLYTGEEAVAVGVCAALETEDCITSTHRGHGHIIAKGGDVKYIMAELCGRKTGYNRGKGGSMHIAAPELGIMGACGIVGGGIPVATGLAFTAHYRKVRRVAVSFFGDAAIAQGSFHESAGIASFLKLPCIYLCENNLYGVSTHQSDVRGIKEITDVAKAYGMPGVSVDGNDVEAVYQAAAQAVSRAREGLGPTFIECRTYRHYGHFCGEPNTYRPEEEIAQWRAPERDPICRYRRKLLEKGICGEEELEGLAKRAAALVEEAKSFAMSSPLPDVEALLDDVYCD
ncbi:thiamine pyrophosphate-dependent dehydrogenase E1 component subunit alpha [uncultured Oscillibacter sp.]|uniref:thiamine pyrophosphate-dependent dehydrogenase E1 component subunit alpha n=1 Tax=uncultured Oscillibacter sp. TaxID=876091 RepID=UPI002637648F|nr:thiamine pyrophosphate-dependent dehydrogenase E1 component subunit alpha [uncultured Oscillibacter sp.]